ncbi:hypothetical protein [Halocynthiibacter namhaensis]|uniref:hypothetical protein n=1 Tax=Halocynthiibacter namhaensis TaxID=1290553 RepID=UPI0005796B31|nr:hypothetical protein [Halocynthiibacter namhaensis]
MFIGMVSVLSGLIAALSAYLQINARWYKGVFAVLGLIALGIGCLFPGVGIVSETELPPVVYLAIAAFWGAIAVGFGVSVTLMARDFAAPRRIVGWVFVTGAVLVPIWMRALV